MIKDRAFVGALLPVLGRSAMPNLASRSRLARNCPLRQVLPLSLAAVSPWFSDNATLNRAALPTCIGPLSLHSQRRLVTLLPAFQANRSTGERWAGRPSRERRPQCFLENFFPISPENSLNQFVKTPHPACWAIA